MEQRSEQSKPCPFRKVRAGHLRCILAAAAEGSAKDGDRQNRRTDVTTLENCQYCDFPEIYTHVNCANLILGREHGLVESFDETGLLQIASVLLHRLQVRCTVYHFKTSEDFSTKCSLSCPAYIPLHRDAGDDDLRLIKFNVKDASDKQLRQAILAMLYRYHSLHPERYRFFDVTPMVLANNLSLKVSNILRVLGPMEDEGELEVSGDYVRITSRGIRMIDEEPLFEQLNTASLRVFRDQYINNGQVAAMGSSAEAESNTFGYTEEHLGA
jgi:hypothetical protein